MAMRPGVLTSQRQRGSELVEYRVHHPSAGAQGEKRTMAVVTRGEMLADDLCW